MPTILVLDDEPVVSEIVKKVLQRAGYSVIAVKTSREAIIAAATFDGSIALMVSNFHLSDGHMGSEAVAQIRRQHPDMKVIHISGYPEEEVARKGGMTDGAVFLQKPFPPQLLIQKVHELLATGRSSSVSGI